MKLLEGAQFVSETVVAMDHLFVAWGQCPKGPTCPCEGAPLLFAHPMELARRFIPVFTTTERLEAFLRSERAEAESEGVKVVENVPAFLELVRRQGLIPVLDPERVEGDAVRFTFIMNEAQLGPDSAGPPS